MSFVRSALLWMSALLLVLIPFGLAFDFGGIYHWSQYVAAVGILIAACMAAAGIGDSMAFSGLRQHALLIPIGILVLWGWIQSVPASPGIVGWLSPGSVTAYRDWMGELISPQVSPIENHPISVSPSDTTHVTGLLAMLLPLGFAASIVFHSRSRLQMLLSAIAIAGASVAVLGFYRKLDPTADLYIFTDRPQSFGGFVNRNNAALMLNFGLAASLGLLSWRMMALHQIELDDPDFEFNDLLALVSDRESFIGLLSATTCAAGLLVNGSRGGLVAAMFGLIIALGYVRPRRGLISIPVLLVVIAISVAILITPMNLNLESLSRMEFWSDNADTLQSDGRLLHWQDGLQAAIAYLPGGSGLSSYAYAYLPYQDQSPGAWFEHADNLWLEMLVETGIVGVLVFVMTLAIVLIALKRLSFSVDPLDQGIRVAGWYAVGAVLMSQVFDFGLALPANLFVAVMIGAAIVSRDVANGGAAVVHDAWDDEPYLDPYLFDEDLDDENASIPAEPDDGEPDNAESDELAIASASAAEPGQAAELELEAETATGSKIETASKPKARTKSQAPTKPKIRLQSQAAGDSKLRSRIGVSPTLAASAALTLVILGIGWKVLPGLREDAASDSMTWRLEKEYDLWNRNPLSLEKMETALRDQIRSKPTPLLLGRLASVQIDRGRLAEVKQWRPNSDDEMLTVYRQTDLQNRGLPYPPTKAISYDESLDSATHYRAAWETSLRNLTTCPLGQEPRGTLLRLAPLVAAIEPPVSGEADQSGLDSSTSGRSNPKTIHDVAARASDQLITIYSGNPERLMRIADAVLARGDHPRATQAFHSALRGNPNLATTVIRTLRTEPDLDVREVIPNESRAMQLAVSDYLNWPNPDPAFLRQAVQTIRCGVNDSMSERAVCEALLGRTFLMLEDIEKAKQKYLQAIRLAPDEPKYRIEFIEALIDRDLPSEALSQARIAADSFPEDSRFPQLIQRIADADRERLNSPTPTPKIDDKTLQSILQ